MKLTQATEDSVLCISFYKDTVSASLFSLLCSNESYTKERFTDNLHNEHMYSVSATDELLEVQWLSENDREVIKEIRKIMDKQNASYFRLIQG